MVLKGFHEEVIFYVPLTENMVKSGFERVFLYRVLYVCLYPFVFWLKRQQDDLLQLLSVK